MSLQENIIKKLDERKDITAAKPVLKRTGKFSAPLGLVGLAIGKKNPNPTAGHAKIRSITSHSPSNKAQEGGSLKAKPKVKKGPAPQGNRMTQMPEGSLQDRILTRLSEQDKPHPGHGPATGQSQSWTKGEKAPEGYTEKKQSTVKKASDPVPKVKTELRGKLGKVPTGSTVGQHTTSRDVKAGKGWTSKTMTPDKVGSKVAAKPKKVASVTDARVVHKMGSKK